MSNITQAKSVIEGIAGKVVSNDNCIKIGEAFGADPEATNEVKAGEFLTAMRQIVIERTRGVEIADSEGERKGSYDAAVARADALIA